MRAERATANTIAFLATLAPDHRLSARLLLFRESRLAIAPACAFSLSVLPSKNLLLRVFSPSHETPNHDSLFCRCLFP